MVRHAGALWTSSLNEKKGEPKLVKGPWLSDACKLDTGTPSPQQTHASSFTTRFKLLSGHRVCGLRSRIWRKGLVHSLGPMGRMMLD
jgi:hypothetical protein